MKAVVYQGPFKVAVEDVENPRIEHPNDVIVRVTSSAICGSDLHMYEGRTAAEPGIVFGHENLGIVQEVGAAVTSIRQGDRVVMPFNVACGFCKNCIAGLMAAYSALIRGASTVFVVVRVPERLMKAEDIGAVPIDFRKGDPVGQLEERTNGEGTDKGVDAVGYQAQAHQGEREEPAVVLNSLVRTVRPTGMVGVPGLYVPADPGAPDEHAKQGLLLVAVGKLFEKGLRLGTGQANVKRYNRQLRDLILAGRAKPSFVVSHELPLEEAPEAYEKFDKRVEGYTKVVLHPWTRVPRLPDEATAARTAGS